VKVAQDQAVKLVAERASALAGGVENTLKASLENTNKTLSTLEAGIRSLNQVLVDLGSKQIIIEQPKKKGWFGRS
jgi:hypothetical protein